MGSVNIDNTGSGADVTLSSDGTDLLLDGTAVGGGGGADLYAANESSPTAQPSATGANAIAIGDSASSDGAKSFAAGDDATISNTGTSSVALGTSFVSGADSFSAVIATNSVSYGALLQNSIAMGPNAKAGSSYTVAIGNNTQATASSGVAIGGNSVASATFTVALGHYSKAATQGKFAFSSNRYAAAGDTQGALYILRQRTTDATSKTLTTSSGGTPTDQQIVLPSGSAYAFHGTIIAKQSGSANAAAWEIKGLIVNNGGTTTLTNSATTVISNTPSWSMALSADDTNDALAITVTGAASTTIAWVANIQTSEVTIA